MVFKVILLPVFLVIPFLFNNCADFESFKNSEGKIISSSLELSTPDMVLSASFNGTGDDLQEIQSLIDSVSPSSGLVEIRLAPRTYTLNCPETSPQGHCLRVVNRGQIRITGVSGQTKLLLSNPRSGFMFVRSMEAFELMGVDIDYIQTPYLQGTVRQVSGQVFQVEVDPGYLEFDHPALSVDLYQSSSAGSFVLDGATGRVRGAIDHWISLSPSQRPQRVSGVPRLWQATTNNTNLSSMMRVGDRYVIGSRANAGTGFTLDSNVNIGFYNVNLYTAPFMGVFAFGTQESLTFDRFNIIPTPGSGRLVSTVADAIHVQNNSAMLKITNSHFEGMGDDALNIYSYASLVGSLVGLESNEVRLKISGNYRFSQGEIIQVTNPSGTEALFGSGGEPRITSVVSESGGVVRLTLDRPRSSLIQENDHAFNVSQSSPGALVVDNVYGPFRGSIRFRSPSGSFARNVFMDSRNNHILTGVDPSFPMEGPITSQGQQELQRRPAEVIDPEIEMPSPEVPEEAPREPSEVPEEAGAWVPVHRYFQPNNNQHSYSRQVNESGKIFEGVSFMVSDVNFSGSIPIYVCANSQNRQMLSSDLSCESFGSRSQLGFIGRQSGSGTSQALYRCYNGSLERHLATVNSSECTANGYIVEGILGYVP